MLVGLEYTFIRYLRGLKKGIQDSVQKWQLELPSAYFLCKIHIAGTKVLKLVNTKPVFHVFKA